MRDQYWHDGYLQLIPENVLALWTFQWAIKIAPTRIRPFTEQDVTTLGPTFLDLEGRPQRVEVGRFLCVGSQGEQWTCSMVSMQDRVAVSEPDADGFCWYRQRDPQPILAATVTEPFVLLVQGSAWTSQDDGGVITWNGKTGDELQMRIVARSIFVATYQVLA